MKNKKYQNVVDVSLTQAQEKDFLKIQATGCKIAFLGLFAVMIVQMLLDNHSWKSLIGEALVFLALSVFIIMSCLKKGIWNKNAKPNLKTNVVISFIVSSIVGLLFLFTGLKYSMDKYTAMTNAAVIFLICLASTVIGLSIAAIYNRSNAAKEELENSDNKEHNQKELLLKDTDKENK